MSVKFLTGTYSSGYTFNGGFGTLAITSTAVVNGTGLTVTVKSQIVNDGTVQATSGKASGIYLKAGGTVTNGSATDAAAFISGYYGVVASGSAAITNYGAIQGGSAGVVLRAGGTVTNGSAADTTASIQGGSFGVAAAYTAATVVNYGTIHASKIGVSLYVGGTATNGSDGHTTALIEGVNYGVRAGGSAAIVNYGTIRSTGGFGTTGAVGVHLNAGTVTNGSATDSAARIAGFYKGVEVRFAATVANYGTIQSTGNSGEGIYLHNGGTVTNGSAAYTAARIAGALSGVLSLAAAATIANYGTIQSTGTAGEGVYLGGGGAVTNGSTGDTAALIEGAFGVVVTHASATIANFGTIQGANGDGIYLKAGGTVTNGSASDSAASISGFYGVLAFGSSAITNYGVIQGVGAGVALAAGGSVTNGSAAHTTASISGVRGVSAGYPSATIANYGTIHGSRFGVTLTAGGTVTNGSTSDTSALISGTGGASGPLFGVEAGQSATVVNYGTILATNGASTYSLGGSIAVYLTAGGSVTNGSADDITALIVGPGGVVAAGATATTVTNFGTIEGTVGAAVTFKSADDRLIVESSAQFVGALAGGGGTLELAGGADTITGLGGSGTMKGATSASFSGFGSYVVDAGAFLTLTGTDALTSGQSLTVAGSLTNTGTLTGPAAGLAGVYLAAGGAVTNGSAADTAAYIAGASVGVLGVGAAAAVANFGTIQSLNGNGVYLTAGGTVTNGSAADTTALIKGLEDGVGAGASAAILNYGTIRSLNGYGVHLSGGTVTNGSATDSTALIEGYYVGVFAPVAAAAIANFGTIQATGTLGTGVQMNGGGTVTNGSLADAAASIAGAFAGVVASPSSATVVNYGTIQSANGAGVDVDAGGAVTNGSASARITGYNGVVANGAATVANLGTIVGASFDGVYLKASGTVTNGSATAVAALVQGQTDGVRVSGVGAIVNYATISGLAGNGVVVFWRRDRHQRLGHRHHGADRGPRLWRHLGGIDRQLRHDPERHWGRRLSERRRDGDQPYGRADRRLLHWHTGGGRGDDRQPGRDPEHVQFRQRRLSARRRDGDQRFDRQRRGADRGGVRRSPCRGRIGHDRQLRHDPEPARGRGGRLSGRRRGGDQRFGR